MKPFIHAKSSAAKYGGTPEDYLDIHDYMDSTKSACADVRHRAVFHSAFGIFIVEKVFGTTRMNSQGRVYSVRDIAEQHVQEDLGFIPSLEQWVKNMPIENWMMGKTNSAKKKFIPMEENKSVIEEFIFTRKEGAGTEVTSLDKTDSISPGVTPTIFDDGTPHAFNIDSFKAKGLYHD